MKPGAKQRIWVRDGWTCQMPACLRPDGDRAIDPALVGADDPWAPSVDHVIPRYAGGTSAPHNLRTAHRRCNAAAADPDAPARKPPGRPGSVPGARLMRLSYFDAFPQMEHQPAISRVYHSVAELREAWDQERAS